RSVPFNDAGDGDVADLQRSHAADLRGGTLSHSLQSQAGQNRSRKRTACTASVAILPTRSAVMIVRVGIGARDFLTCEGSGAARAPPYTRLRSCGDSATRAKVMRIRAPALIEPRTVPATLEVPPVRQ